MQYLIILLLFTSCGWNGRQHIVQDGESYTYVVLRLEFLEDVRQLCLDANIRSDYTTEELYNQAVARCTLDNLNIFNIDLGATSAFADQYCNVNADLSTVNPADIPSIQSACDILGLPSPPTPEAI